MLMDVQICGYENGGIIRLCLVFNGTHDCYAV